MNHQMKRKYIIHDDKIIRNPIGSNGDYRW